MLMDMFPNSLKPPAVYVRLGDDAIYSFSVSPGVKEAQGKSFIRAFMLRGSGYLVTGYM